MDVQHLLDIVFGLLLTIVGGFAKMIHAKIEKTSEELSRQKEHIARINATNENLDKRFDRVEDKLDRLFEKLEGK